MLGENEIEEIRSAVGDSDGRYPGMSYEDGVRDTLDVISGDMELEEFLEQFTGD